MTLIDHLEELRFRLFVAIGAWLVATSVMFVFRTRLLEWLRAPLPEAIPLTYFTILEPFVASMQIATFFGFIAASPVILGQVWGFVAPGLYPEERRWAIPFVLLSVLAFAAGSAFAYYIVLPLSLPILLGFLGDAAVGFLSIGRYIGNLLVLMGLFGAMFDMPVLAFLFARIGLLTPAPLVRYRRYAIIVGVTAAAVITPTGDPFNLALVAVPLVVLYELSILVVRVAQRRADHERDNPEVPQTH